jgi:calcineurin-like phosphoesterase family protein
MAHTGKTFLIADTHWGHENICKFTTYDNKPVRPWDTVAEMDEAMVQLWNETVSDGDKVYVLGDAVINRKHLPIFDRLNGKKALIKGNHDIFPLKDYTKYFYDVRAYQVMNGMILSHIPIHKESIARFGANVHGHLHSNRVMHEVFDPTNVIGYKADGTRISENKKVIDPDYFCVSAEHTGFKPMLFDDVCQAIIDQGGKVGFRNGKNHTQEM